jgi:glucose/arabinose dehydrogenase
MGSKKTETLATRGRWRTGLLGLALAAATACGAATAGQPTVVPGGTVVSGGLATPTVRTDTGSPAPSASAAAATATAPATPPASATVGATPTSVPATTVPAASPTPVPTAGAGGTAAAPTFRVEEVATGLDTPWELAFAPDGRIFVTERPGRLRVIEGGRLRTEPVATVPDVVEQGEGGLLGIVLDPDFANNGVVYLYHTYRRDGMRNRVIAYTLQDRAGARGLTAPRVVIDNIPAGSTHNGGRIAFGPDGKLYITAGDAGTTATAQDRNSLAGKILRLNADGTVPADNPFPGSPVYSYGHRNPQGLAWQPGTNALYATEHGSSANDEINRITPGGNYGWPTITGTQTRDGMIAPVLASGSGNTWAPSGATFVRGEGFAAWRGSLIFTGLRSTTLWRLDLTNPASPRLSPILEDTHGRLRAVHEGADGSLYVLTSSQDGRGNPAGNDDRLLRLVPGR